ncbi:MAG: hypothetical protein QNJ37_21025 [Crocosphaera sp.]|nr:hypothetical protein [Crocosphaera sp.]
MTNQTNSDNQNSFYTWLGSIFTWLIKAFSIFCFASLFILNSIPKFLQKTSSNLEDLEVSTTGVSMKFSSDGKLKTLKIINVPAYQPGVFSSIKLEKDKIIEIQATGLVTTGGTFPLEAQENNNENDKWGEAIKQLKLNADFQVGWRDPNGEFLFATPQEPERCLHEVAEKRKLEKKLPYGYLLGIIVDLGPNIDEIKAAAYQLQRINNNDKSLPFNLVNKQGNKVGEIKKIIAIGQKATIKFNNTNNNYEIEGEDLSSFDKTYSLRTFSAKLSESYIYFVVNDTLLENQDAFKNINDELEHKENKEDCFNEIGLKEDKSIKNWRGEMWNRQKELYEEFEKSSTNNLSSLWFLNNQGSFSVAIIEIKK